MPGTTQAILTSGWKERTLPVGLLVLLGVILGGSAIEFLMTHPDPPVWWRMELLAVTGVTIGIVYVGYRLFDGYYTSTDSWKVLGWTAAGAVGAATLGSAIYAHQQMEHVSIAEPTFLLEFLALVGAGVGLAFGVSRRLTFDRTPQPRDEAMTEVDAGFWDVLSLLGSDSKTLRQRWTMVEYLADTSTGELPTTAYIIQLADDRAPVFPEDEAETKSLVYDEHLPVLLQNGLVEIDDELGTIKYVGPDSVSKYTGGE